MNINVTRPFLPPIEVYQRYIEGIWKRNWLTNHGPLVSELELELKHYLELDHLLYVTNGTIALQVAIKALGLSGEIITTPFSYVATTTSILWEGCTPVMVDIDPDTFNINPELIESAITERTSAILATHVYGNPCDVEAIEQIARKHGLKVIYDAAHAFGTKVNGQSVFGYGDMSTCSFHATKLFHTVEGGAIITPRPELLKAASRLRNFGHVTAESFDGIGINGKNSEFHAAMGLCNLNYVDEILARRQFLSERYDSFFANVPLQRPAIRGKVDYNHAYYAVAFPDEKTLLTVVEGLSRYSIAPRRYFYPSLNRLPYLDSQACPVSEDLSKRVLALPLYHDLSIEELDLIARIVIRTMRYGL